MAGFCNFAKFHPEKVISNLKTVFESPFSLAYVLFVAMSTVYHVDGIIFGVTVDMIRDRSSFPSSRKSVVGAAVGYPSGK